MTVKDAITEKIQVQWFAERIFHSKDELDKVPQAGDRWQVCAPPPGNVVTEDPGTARLRVVCVSDSDFLKRVAVGYIEREDDENDEGFEQDIPFTSFIKKLNRAEGVGDTVPPSVPPPPPSPPPPAANDASTQSAHTGVSMVAESSTPLAICPGPGEVWSIEAEKDDVSDAKAQKPIESAKSAKILVRAMSCADLEADYVMVENLDGVGKGGRSEIHAKRFIERMADEEDPLFNAAVSSLPKDKLGSLSCRLPPRKNNHSMAVYSPQV